MVPVRLVMTGASSMAVRVLRHVMAVLLTIVAAVAMFLGESGRHGQARVNLRYETKPRVRRKQRSLVLF